MTARADELLMDHLRSPYHQGRLREITHAARAVNSVRGDQLELQLWLSAGGFLTADYDDSAARHPGLHQSIE